MKTLAQDLADHPEWTGDDIDILNTIKALPGERQPKPYSWFNFRTAADLFGEQRADEIYLAMKAKADAHVPGMSLMLELLSRTGDDQGIDLGSEKAQQKLPIYKQALALTDDEVDAMVERSTEEVPYDVVTYGFPITHLDIAKARRG